MTEELRDAIEKAFFPYITDPDKRRRLADLAARIAEEHDTAPEDPNEAADPTH